MQQFTLAEGDTTGHVFAPLYPVPGDHLLIVERELLYKGKKVGSISAVLTFMEVFPPDDAVVLGIAEHHLSNKGPAKEGVISVQGSFRFSDQRDLVFSIVGGTGSYRNARGTVTLGQHGFTYRVN
jgi:hypothetical protein